MPFRRAVYVLALVLLAGCTAQRDVSDVETPDADEEVAVSDTTQPDDAPIAPGGAPNIAVYLDGMWDIVLSPADGGDAIRGAWRVEEGGENRFVDFAGGAPIEVTDRSVSGDMFYVAGIATTDDGPLPFEVSGTLNGNDMSGEAMLEGMGTYALSGTRRPE